MAKLSSLVGQRFGKLTVTEQGEPDRYRQRQWICLCDCGTVCTVTTHRLTHNPNISCGCTRRRDLSGMRFGRLVVLERSDVYAPRGKVKTRQWKCLCDCGQITYKATDTLTNADMSMCRECAGKYAASRAREHAGYVDGTQLTKICDMTPTAANTSGVRGVYYISKTGYWRADIYFKGKRHYLGTYKKKDDAVQARRDAEERLFSPFLRQLAGEDGDGACRGK